MGLFLRVDNIYVNQSDALFSCKGKVYVLILYYSI